MIYINLSHYWVCAACSSFTYYKEIIYRNCENYANEPQSLLSKTNWPLQKTREAIF